MFDFCFESVISYSKLIEYLIFKRLKISNPFPSTVVTQIIRTLPREMRLRAPPQLMLCSFETRQKIERLATQS
jgi:hypothetical protein